MRLIVVRLIPVRLIPVRLIPYEVYCNEANTRLLPVSLNATKQNPDEVNSD